MLQMEKKAGDGFNLYRVAIDKYQKQVLEAKENNDKEALKEARWKIKYFKDEIRKRKAKEDD